MTSRAQKRRQKKVSAGLRFRSQDLSKPKSPLLAEDIHKLHDPFFFNEKNVALTEKTTDCFYWSGIREIGDLIQKTENDLLAIPGFGKVSLDKTKTALKSLKLGLSSR